VLVSASSQMIPVKDAAMIRPGRTNLLRQLVRCAAWTLSAWPSCVVTSGWNPLCGHLMCLAADRLLILSP